MGRSGKRKKRAASVHNTRAAVLGDGEAVLADEYTVRPSMSLEEKLLLIKEIQATAKAQEAVLGRRSGINFIKEKISDQDLAGVNFQGSVFRDSHFLDSSFASEKLAGEMDRLEVVRSRFDGCSFSPALLRQGHWQDVIARSSDFYYSDLSETIFSSGIYQACRFEGGKMDGVVLENEARFLDCRFSHFHTWERFQASGVELKNCSFSTAKISDSDFSSSSLRGSTFSDISLRSSDFSDTDLAEVILYGHGANREVWQDVCFDRARFQTAKIKNIAFQDCHFQETEISNSRFENCQIARSVFPESRLEGVEFVYCDFQDADLSGISGQVSFQGCNLSGAILPDQKIYQTENCILSSGTLDPAL